MYEVLDGKLNIHKCRFTDPPRFMNKENKDTFINNRGRYASVPLFNLHVKGVLSLPCMTIYYLCNFNMIV